MNHEYVLISIVQGLFTSSQRLNGNDARFTRQVIYVLLRSVSSVSLIYCEFIFRTRTATDKVTSALRSANITHIGDPALGWTLLSSQTSHSVAQPIRFTTVNNNNSLA